MKSLEYNFAIDKGTLDAIAVDNDEKTVEMCQSYFKEMVRVLAKDGIFMMVSLLQPHVLKIILDFFIKGNQLDQLFSIKIFRIEHIEGYAEKQFIKYLVVIKKTFIDTSDDKMVKFRETFQN